MYEEQRNGELSSRRTARRRKERLRTEGPRPRKRIYYLLCEPASRPRPPPYDSLVAIVPPFSCADGISRPLVLAHATHPSCPRFPLRIHSPHLSPPTAMAGILHGARSVIFLYASCAPCYDLQRKYRTAKKSKKEMAAKEELITAQPNLYHHPSPMQTNPFWAEEIEAGPNFLKGSKPRSGLENQDGTRDGNKAASSGDLIAKKQVSDRNLTSASGGSATPSSPTVMGDSVSVIEPIDESRWNHKRYQREDEGLWGIDIRVDRLMAGQRFVIDALSSGSWPLLFLSLIISSYSKLTLCSRNISIQHALHHHSKYGRSYSEVLR